MSKISWCAGDRAAPGGLGTPARAPAAAAAGAQLASGGHGNETAADYDPYRSSRVFLLYSVACSLTQSSAPLLAHSLGYSLTHLLMHALAHSFMLWCPI